MSPKKIPRNLPAPSGTLRNLDLAPAPEHTGAYLGWRPQLAYAAGNVASVVSPQQGRSSLTDLFVPQYLNLLEPSGTQPQLARTCWNLLEASSANCTKTCRNFPEQPGICTTPKLIWADLTSCCVGEPTSGAANCASRELHLRRQNFQRVEHCMPGSAPAAPKRFTSGQRTSRSRT